jgi:hypothetical protein
MATSETRRLPVRLSYRDGQVMVTPEDKSIFFISADKDTEACKNAVRYEERVQQFENELIFPLRDWCEVRADKVSACYFCPSEAGVLPVFVVGRTEEYDFALSKDVSDLAIIFESKGWSLDPHLAGACPDEELYSLFNTDLALQIYSA